MKKEYASRLLLLFLVVYVGLGITYASNTPLFESPDESSHLQVIRFIRLRHQLPPYQIPPYRVDSGEAMAWLIAYHDPPLYYAPPLYHTLGAVLTAWTEMADLPSRLVPSPSWAAGFAPQQGSDPWNKNVFVHMPGESVRASQTVRATVLLRALSILLGCVTIWAAYRAGELMWSDRPGWALTSAMLVALNPQFIAAHAAVSNDPLTIALCSLSVVALLAAMRKEEGWPGWALAGVPVGMGILTKQSALLLLPLGVLAAWVGSTQESEEDWLARIRVFLMRSGAFLLAAGLIGGWWYARNLVLYNDLLGTRPHYAVQVALAHFDLSALRATCESYWAAFGWALITLPPWLYAFPSAVLLAALWGGLRGLLSDGRFWHESLLVRRALVLCAVAVGLNLLTFVSWARATGAPYGRLLFPTVVPTGLLLAYGLAGWRGGAYSWLGAALGVGALILAALVPWLWLRPAFDSPYRPGGMPASALRLSNTCGNGVCLLGYEGDERALAPGGTLRLTLYWRAEAPTSGPLTLWAQLAGIDPTKRVAEDTRWLGGTLYPSEFWRAGDVVAHTIQLQVPRWAEGPALYWVRLGLTTATDAPVRLGSGEGFVTLGPWPLRRAVRVPRRATPVGARFGDAIKLQAFEAGVVEEQVEVTLYWACQRAPGRDLTVFVHLVDATGQMVAQHDGLPAQGAYPTSWWRAGDIVADHHRLVFPSSSHTPRDLRLRVGLYEADTGRRWPVVDVQGAPQPDDAFVLPFQW